MVVSTLPNSKKSSKDLEDYMKRLDYGEFVSFEKLTEIAELDVQGKYRYVLESAKRALLRHHDRVLISKRGEGYVIGTPETIVAESSSRRKKAYNQVRGSVEIVKTIDMSKLSHEEQQKVVHEQKKNHFLLVSYRATENKLLNDPTDKVQLGDISETTIVKTLLERAEKL